MSNRIGRTQVRNTPARCTAGVVNNSFVAQHKRHVIERVIQFGITAPGVEAGLRHPRSINWIVPGWLHFPNSDQAFMRRRIIRKARTGWG